MPTFTIDLSDDALILARCERDLQTECVELKSNPSRYGDRYVATLLLTVLDFMRDSAVVAQAMNHYLVIRQGNPSTHEELCALLDAHSDDDVAQLLWDNRFWDRARLLRRFMAFLNDHAISDLASLKHWFLNSEFSDFEPKVTGMKLAIYQWLVMRLGRDTVKPDSRVLRFVAATTGEAVPDNYAAKVEVILAIERAAKAMNLSAVELDCRIWEYERLRDASGTADRWRCLE